MIHDTGIDLYVNARGLTHKLLNACVDDCPDLIGLFHMDRGWLQSPLWVPITEDGCTFLDFSRTFARSKYEFLYSEAFSKNLDAAAAQPLRNVFVLGGSANHYHLLIDFLPRLYFFKLRPELGDLQIVIDAEVTTAQQDLIRSILRRLGAPAPRFTAVGPGVHALQNAMVPSGVSRRSAVAIWTRHFQPVNHATAGGPRRLFVMRNGVSRRHLLNQEQVASRLQQSGFACVDPGGLSLEEQIELFAGARLIVGAHGAALTNVLFAPPGAVLFELYVNVLQSHFGVLAAAKRIRHYACAGTSAGGGQGDHNDDFTIDPNALMAMLAPHLD